MQSRESSLVRSRAVFLLSLYVALVPSAPSASAGNYDFSLFPAHPSAAQGSNPRTSFQTDEFTGSFGYQVPIELPPARAGAMPNVALSYGSGGANGWLGVGWSLDVGHIERDGRDGVPIKWGTGALPLLPQNPLQYDDTHGFTFSFRGKSSRLALVNAGTGEYRPEIDNDALKFVLGSSGWTVTDKSGSVHKFGFTSESANSRMDIPLSETSATGNAKTFRWSLSSSQDPNGNRVVYEYTAPVAPFNQIYLDKIRYNGHTSQQPAAYTHVVEFGLQDRVDGFGVERDVPLSFRSGYRVETKKRLKTITTKVSGVRARQYELVYTQSPSSGRSLLSQVKEYGKSGTTTVHPPIQITYQTQNLSFGPVITWGSTTGTLLHQPSPNIPTSGTRNWNALGYKTSGFDDLLGSRSMNEVMDYDRDGLPDRVLTDQDFDVGVPNPNDPPNMYLVQHNTSQFRAGFDDALKTYGFAPWLNQGFAAAMRGSLGWTGTNMCNLSVNGKTFLKLVDVNGDGFVDRVHDWQRFAAAPTLTQQLNFYVEYGNGTGYGPLTAWGPIENHGNPNNSSGGSLMSDTVYAGSAWNSPEYALQDCDMTGGASCGVSGGGCIPNNSVGALVATLMDANGDGLPDRLLRLGNDQATTRDHFLVQLNVLNAQGQATFGPLQKWEFDNEYVPDPFYWNNPFTFESGTTANSNTSVGLFDVNGDGLPDRLMRKVGSCLSQPASYFNNWVVQYNKGFGFEEGQPPTYFGPLQMPGGVSGFNGCSYANPSSSEDFGVAGGNEGSFTIAMLQDANGDGSVDRIIYEVTQSLGVWTPTMWVQMNEGSRLGDAQLYGNVQVPANACNVQYPGPWHYAQASMPYPWPCEPQLWPKGNMEHVQFKDINGDGLADRLMSNPTVTGNPGLRVQLAQGDVPDLLERIENGLGGKISVEYLPSTHWVNRDIDVPVGQTPWQANAKSLLSSVIQTTSSVTVEDGIHAPATTTYAYFGGMYDYADKEFRGFHKTTKTDPSGASTVTWFHQDGGMDHSTLGEYRDVFNGVPSHSKRGMPFRIESRDAAGNLYQLVIHKVDERQLTANVERWFPFVAQTATQNYEGLGSPRTTAETFEYFETGTFATNLKKHTKLGEGGFTIATNAFSNSTTTDDLVSEMTYATVSGNAEIRDRVDFEFAKNSGGTILRQTDYDYETGTGNRTTTKRWRDLPTAAWLTETFTYDAFGNVVDHTRPGAGTLANPSGTGATVTKHTLWDPIYHEFPIEVTDDFGTGTFNYTAFSTFDELSGEVETSTDWNGVTTRNVFDLVFHRVVDVWLDVPNAPSIWQQHYDYQFGGASGGTSANRMHRVVNDGSSTTLYEGHHTYTYSDGFGRVIQSRVESERLASPNNPDYRITDTRFDERGNPMRETREHFSPGSGFTALDLNDAHTLTTYDALGRPITLTPPVGDVPASMTGVQTTDYHYLSDPWVRVLKDGKRNTAPFIGSERREHRDAFGRIEKVEEVVAGSTVYSTNYEYDLFGDLTEILDHKLNKTTYTYDSLGRRLTTVDPDLGSLATTYFDDGSISSATDGEHHRTEHLYDNLARVAETKVFADGASTEDELISYLYDDNTDGTGTTYPVFKGQLFKVTSTITSGFGSYTRNGYDVRGHIIKTLKFVAKNGVSYVTTYGYDDVGRLITMAYPRTSAAVQYVYDTAGNLERIQATSGTYPTNEVFYDVEEFDELRQPMRIAYGNGVLNTFDYFPKSKRLERVRAQLGTNAEYLNLDYTYDAVGNVLSIDDNVAAHTGLASGARSSIQYDSLYRMTSYTRPTASGTQAFAFDYDEIGNMKSNADFGGDYTYPNPGANSVRPHAVSTAVDSVPATHVYGYDDAGNMTTRGVVGTQQTLDYNSRNLLTRVTNYLGVATNFGYDAQGKRLWKQKGTPLTVWIGEHYEERGGRRLCHVIADGRRICTFQPIDPPTPGHPLEIGPPGAPGPVFDYYHQDQIRSATVITNRNGTLAQAYQYSAFGAELYVQSSTEYPLLNRFTDQTWDAETGLYYFGSRYYDPAIGRFIQPDTQTPDVYKPQALNRYTYVLNNPFRYIDPTGHSWWDSIKNAVKGAILGDFAGEDLGIAGMVGQIAVGLSPLGVLADVRDFAAAGVKVIKGEGSLGELALAGAGLVPGVSEARKFTHAAGEASEVVGAVLKHSDEIAEAGGKLVRRAEDVADLAKGGGKISMDKAVEMAANHVEGRGVMELTGKKTNFQFRNTVTNAAGDTETKIGRFDINPADKAVQKQGPHLNIETQINGKIVSNDHYPIDPSTIRPGDHP